jgi:hypothetical protein
MRHQLASRMYSQESQLTVLAYLCLVVYGTTRGCESIKTCIAICYRLCLVRDSSATGGLCHVNIKALILLCVAVGKHPTLYVVHPT